MIKTELEWYDVIERKPDSYSEHGNVFLSKEVLVLLQDGEIELDVYYRKGIHTENGWKQLGEGWNSGENIVKWAYINLPK